MFTHKSSIGNAAETVGTRPPAVRRAVLLLVAAAIGALALLDVFQALPAQAQSAATLVSNTGQSASAGGVDLNSATPKRA